MLHRKWDETLLLSTDKCKSEIFILVDENDDVCLNKNTTLTNLFFQSFSSLFNSPKIPPSQHADKIIWPTTKESEKML